MMMLRRPISLKRIDDGIVDLDSGAETAESDCSKMSLPTSEAARRRQQQQQMMMMMVMNMHLLANPGDSLLLQQTLDRLLRWLCPSLRIFHVSERAAPLRAYARSSRLCPFTGYPSLAVTFFLHEAYGEERILRVLDFLQRPPWQYHHTESGGGGGRGVHITGGGVSSSASPADALLRPYLLPSRDFYSLGAGMPVWGVRPVHCGGEVLRVTLYSAYDNYEDAVRLYETVLQQQAEEQKAGFCWFTLHTEPGLCLQLAVKQLSPGIQVEPCSSAVLQFRVEEIGQLVPLLPNPCSPISASRWQTEDLDGNKILFQVKTPAQPPRPLTCAFPLACPSTSPREGSQLRGSGGHTPPAQSHAHGLGTPPLSWTGHRPGHRPRTDPGLEKPCAAGESLGSDSCCSTPPGSSCYSSQRSSPCPALPPPSTGNHRESPLRPNISRSLSHLLLEEEDEEEEPETNVDTGVPVSPRSDAGVFTAPPRRPVSMDVSSAAFPQSERPAAVGASALESLARELIECLPAKHLTPPPPPPPGAARTFWAAASCKAVSSSAMEGCGGRTGAAGCKSVSSVMEGCGGRTVAAGRSPSKEPVVERTLRAPAVPLVAKTLFAHNKHNHELDEFFI